MDKKFGAPWHVVIGEGFSFEITYEVRKEEYFVALSVFAWGTTFSLVITLNLHCGEMSPVTSVHVLRRQIKISERYVVVRTLGSLQLVARQHKRNMLSLMQYSQWRITPRAANVARPLLDALVSYQVAILLRYN